MKYLIGSLEVELSRDEDKVEIYFNRNNIETYTSLIAVLSRDEVGELAGLLLDLCSEMAERKL